MKRLWNCGKRATASGGNAEDFSDGTSFLVRRTPDHANGTRRLTGNPTDLARRASPHDDGTARIGGDIPDYLGGFPSLTGGTSGVASGVSDLAMSPHGAAMSLPGVAMSFPCVASCVSRLTRGVSGAVGDVSGVDRWMEMKDLCGFAPLANFPFGAVKQNTEKPQKHDKNTKINQQQNYV